jgi:hypothetical protein
LYQDGEKFQGVDAQLIGLDGVENIWWPLEEPNYWVEWAFCTKPYTPNSPGSACVAPALVSVFVLFWLPGSNDRVGRSRLRTHHLGASR